MRMGFRRRFSFLDTGPLVVRSAHEGDRAAFGEEKGARKAARAFGLPTNDLLIDMAHEGLQAKKQTNSVPPHACMHRQHPQAYVYVHGGRRRLGQVDAWPPAVRLQLSAR